MAPSQGRGRASIQPKLLSRKKSRKSLPAQQGPRSEGPGSKRTAPCPHPMLDTKGLRGCLMWEGNPGLQFVPVVLPRESLNFVPRTRATQASVGHASIKPAEM